MGACAVAAGGFLLHLQLEWLGIKTKHSPLVLSSCSCSILGGSNRRKGVGRRGLLVSLQAPWRGD